MIKTIFQSVPMMEIDLAGPDGNAQKLLAYAKKLSYTLGLSEQETEDVLKEMTIGDYEHLIRVFESNFGEFVIMYR